MAEQPPTSQNESSTYGRGIWISYKIGIRTRLRSSLHSAARFFRIMPKPAHSLFEEFEGLKEEQTGYSDVLAYYRILSDLYKSAATCNIDRDRWKVTTLFTYKSRGRFEHESVVAHVQCEEESVYLRIERRRQEAKAKEGKLSKSSKIQSADDSDETTDPTETLPRPPRGGSSSRAVAQDGITYSKFIRTLVKSKEDCVDAIQFPKGKELTLPQLAVLARCASKKGRFYSLFDENCYWFAHVMAETTKLIQPDFQLESTSKRKLGTWSDLLTTKKPTPELIKEMKTEYEDSWIKFNDEIYKSINNENSEIYQAERRKREDAERLEKEERQKRQDAERLEKEERQKRKDAEEEIRKLKAELAAAKAK